MLQERKVTCPHCRKGFGSIPRLTTLGFQKFLCPKCDAVFVYPLARRSYYGVALGVLAIVVLLSLAGYSQTSFGNRLLAEVVGLSLYVLERVSYLLFPLGAWAVLRLIGINYSQTLPAARKILRWTGILAAAGIMIEILGLVASLILRGFILEPLAAALVSACALLLILGRDRTIRARLEKA